MRACVPRFQHGAPNCDRRSRTVSQQRRLCRRETAGVCCHTAFVRVYRMFRALSPPRLVVITYPARRNTGVQVHSIPTHVQGSVTLEVSYETVRLTASVPVLYPTVTTVALCSPVRYVARGGLFVCSDRGGIAVFKRIA